MGTLNTKGKIKRTPTIRAVIEARSQFVGGFGSSGLTRCGRGSPARLLSHNRALCEQFGRDWVVGCSRWIGATLILRLVGSDTKVLNGKTTVYFHVFMGLSATLGVVSCKCFGELQFKKPRSYGRFGFVQGCVGDDRFVEGSFSVCPCIVNSEGEVVAELVAELEGDTQCDLFGFWVSNKKWLVRVEPLATVKKLIVWRVDSNGVPVSSGVVVKCTVPLGGGAVRISPFDPCGDEIVFVGQQQPVEGHQPLPTISFVDLEKSIEAGVTVVVSKKIVFLPDSSPCDLIWASPSTILILCRSHLGGNFRVINTVTGEVRVFAAEMYRQVTTAWPSHITASRKGGTSDPLAVCEVYCASSDLSQPSCCYDSYWKVQQCHSTCGSIYCMSQIPTSSSSTLREVSICDTITGKSLAVLTYDPHQL